MTSPELVLPPEEPTPEQYQLLGFTEPDLDALPIAIETAWRKARSKLHPDRGGNKDEFGAALLAYDRCMAWAKRQRSCEKCGGSGRVSKVFRCEDCLGTGRVSYA